LPDDYRRVIELRYLEEQSFEEIGARMQRSADAARKLWARAVERLQQELESPDGPR
jgi:RNA polymerase sigma-70 factor (ECF subfamily)